MVLPRADTKTELARLAREVLPILEEGRAAFGVELLHFDLPVVDPEGHGERRRAFGPLAPEDDAHDVLGPHRETVQGVDGVGEAQAGRVVVEERDRARLDLRARRLKPDERRLGRLGAVEGRADDPLGRGHVALHEGGGDRKDVADVIEAIACVVLGEVVGGAQVDTQEIAHRVVVLGAVQAPRRDAARIGRGLFVGPRQSRLDPFGDGLHLSFGEDGESRGRHHTRLHLRDDLLPWLRVGHHRGLGLVGLEIQVGIAEHRVVA